MKEPPRPWPQMYDAWPWPNGIPHAATAPEPTEEQLLESHHDDRDEPNGYEDDREPDPKAYEHGVGAGSGAY